MAGSSTKVTKGNCCPMPRLVSSMPHGWISQGANARCSFLESEIIWQSEFLAHPEIWFAGNHSIPEPSGRSCFIRRVLAVRLALKANTLAWSWADPWIHFQPCFIPGTESSHPSPPALA